MLQPIINEILKTIMNNNFHTIILKISIQRMTLTRISTLVQTVLSIYRVIIKITIDFYIFT